MSQLALWSGRVPRRKSARLETRNATFLLRARKYAKWHAETHGRVTADDVRAWAARRWIAPDHPNAWGAIFKGNEFVMIGTECSSTESRRGGIIRIWSVRDA